MEKKEWKKWLLLSRLAQLQVFLKKKKRGTDGFKTAEKSRKVARVVPFGYLLVFFFCFLKSNKNTAVETHRPLTREPAQVKEKSKAGDFTS